MISKIKPIVQRKPCSGFTDYWTPISWCIKYINPDDILYIQTNNNGSTVKVHLVNGEMLDGVHLALNKWKASYDLPDFMQIHRSHLVNLNHVNGHKPDPYRVEGHNVTFRGCAVELAVGKSYLDDLLKALGSCPRTNMTVSGYQYVVSF